MAGTGEESQREGSMSEGPSIQVDAERRRMLAGTQHIRASFALMLLPPTLL